MNSPKSLKLKQPIVIVFNEEQLVMEKVFPSFPSPFGDSVNEFSPILNTSNRGK